MQTNSSPDPIAKPAINKPAARRIELIVADSINYSSEHKRVLEHLLRLVTLAVLQDRARGWNLAECGFGVELPTHATLTIEERTDTPQGLAFAFAIVGEPWDGVPRVRACFLSEGAVWVITGDQPRGAA